MPAWSLPRVSSSRRGAGGASSGAGELLLRLHEPGPGGDSPPDEERGGPPRGWARPGHQGPQTRLEPRSTRTTGAAKATFKAPSYLNPATLEYWKCHSRAKPQPQPTTNQATTQPKHSDVPQAARFLKANHREAPSQLRKGRSLFTKPAFESRLDRACRGDQGCRCQIGAT
jgi:hypothetical protein